MRAIYLCAFLYPNMLNVLFLDVFGRLGPEIRIFWLRPVICISSGETLPKVEKSKLSLGL